MLLLASILAPAPAPAFSQPEQVQAMIPNFPVKVNGTLVDNRHARYPLLVYKDITYFPLTWDMAQALSWQVNWSETEGLKVFSSFTTRGGAAYGYVKSPLQQDLSASNQSNVLYQAQLADFPVSIQNESIDNGNEAYPLLTFRDITYFPLTWRFAHDLLNIDLQWDEQEGLTIRSPQQPVLERIIFDDTDHLYFRPALVTKPNYTLLRVDKSLTETPVWVTAEEAKAVNPKLDLTSSGNPVVGADVTASLRTEGDSVFYKNMKLDLEPDPRSEGANNQEVVHNARWLPLGEQEGLLSLITTDKLIGVPLHSPPYRAELFLVNGETATKLSGYKDIPQGVIANPDGSYWIYANIDRKGDIRDYYYRSAQLALLDKDGGFHLINDRMSAEFINVLGADNLAVDHPAQPDGTITFEVFEKNPVAGAYTKPGGTIYTIDTKRQVKSLYQYDHGIPFMDQNQRIFIYDPDKNAITSLHENKTTFWWDYELLKP